jgi:colicin import membrane protein
VIGLGIKTKSIEFRPNYGLSLIVHGTLFAVLLLRTVFFPSQAINYEAAIRVDVVGMPEKNRRLPDPVKEKKAEPKKEGIDKVLTKKKKPAKKIVALKNSKPSRDQLLKRFEALHDIEKTKKAKPKKGTQGDGLVRGNRLSPGTALKGLSKLNYESYIGSLDQHVKKYWLLPEWLADSDLKAQALILLDDKGYVVRKMLVQPSGNQTYDNLVLEAIDKASPFPMPPDKFVDIVAVDGIVFGFPE